MSDLNINPEIILHVENNIIPLYRSFDSAHGVSHVRKVIANSLDLADMLEAKTDINMVYVIAAYHDVGLIHGREGHETSSAAILTADKALERWFSEAQIKIMAQAVEDHRASNDYEPRSIYGKIVAEADRDINYDTILTRTVQYSVEKYPDYSPGQHYERCLCHIQDKYGEGGYLKLWLDIGKNRENLDALQYRLKDARSFEKDFYSKLGDISEQ